ncbi:choline ABC transporter ATP-binding protein [Roseibium aggregatum]|uniref:Trimethylamine N-oxide transport system ATP-binding protein TmoW n=1 Tax=Roseibium aggregatum TaxID=187304 RepID=A0A926NVM9_9HYPH|nr:choline ABC transporter ATP-binding protein [Roseibium aggregatum]MBD1544638.1 choline ABC transporter ATP-binding protein [Roseibium aggregatum]
MTEPVVSFNNVDIVFGSKPQTALPLIDAGMNRAEIQDKTGQVLGVAGATFDINEGEVIVLMGLSGSGKSTLLRAVNGLNPVIRGEVLVRNGDKTVNPATCSQEELRQLRRHRIAMVFQQFALLPWRTVAENVGFGLELSGMKPAERREKVSHQLKLVGLEGWGGMQVHELSGGMQQRVGLARAFATEAPVLLMDEPFSALDPLIRDRLQDELLDFQASLNRTIIFVSHDLDEAAKIGSRIAIMDGGRVIQLGTPQEIVRKPANDYVADFVGHMNPLNVLRAKDIMSACDRTPVPEGAVTCLAATPLRDVIKLKRQSETEILVAEEGRVLGRIGEGELLDSMI